MARCRDVECAVNVPIHCGPCCTAFRLPIIAESFGFCICTLIWTVDSRGMSEDMSRNLLFLERELRVSAESKSAILHTNGNLYGFTLLSILVSFDDPADTHTFVCNPNINDPLYAHYTLQIHTLKLKPKMENG